MKKQICCLMAACMTLLSACGAASTAAETASPTAAAPSQPASSAAETAAASPAASGVIVSDETTQDNVEEVISLNLQFPSLTGAGEAGQTIADYYAAQKQKLTDYAQNTLYEQASANGDQVNLTAEYSVETQTAALLSVRRTVTEQHLGTSITKTTLAAETFSLENGGLYTLDDLFTIDETAYTSLLTDGIHDRIDADPNRDTAYYAQWADCVTRCFDKTRFYLTDDALVIYYQADELGGGTDCVLEYSFPFSELGDAFRLPGASE